MQTIANKPKYSYNPTRRDGAGIIDNLKDLPNYIPGDQDVVTIVSKPYELQDHEEWVGKVTSYNSPVTSDDYVQPREFWQVTLGHDPAQQERLVGNVAASLSKARPDIRQGSYGTTVLPHPQSSLHTDIDDLDIFTQIDSDLGERIKKATEAAAADPVQARVANHYLL